MRPFLEAGCISAIVVAAIVAHPVRANAQVVLGKQVNVAVDIRCLSGNGVSVTLSPWSAQLFVGDSIAWLLNQDAGVSEITITPKQSTSWPFTSNGPYKGNAKTPPKGKGMKATVKPGDRYSYNVTAACVRADGTTSNVVIDPDMIIIGGN
ncbi:MAG TPA: hypothetical protein VHM24_02500 [Gemmatimonadaceae bacterium]|nr:hypothetical protein [Gemmatimonadaceae bacterium]